MKKTILLLLALTCSSAVFAQKVFDKLARDICKCIEKEEVAHKDEAYPCFENTLLKNVDKIKEHYQVSTLEEVNLDELSVAVSARLSKNCARYVALFRASSTIKEPVYEKDKDLKCEVISAGEFYYLTPDEEGNFTDTTFVTINKDRYLEKMNGGKNFAMLKIHWKNDCNFVLTFVHSDDPVKGNYSKPGDKYTYEIIQSNEKSLVLKGQTHGEDFYVEFFRRNKP